MDNKELVQLMEKSLKKYGSVTVWCDTKKLKCPDCPFYTLAPGTSCEMPLLLDMDYADRRKFEDEDDDPFFSTLLGQELVMCIKNSEF
jgi:hypothetical protein